MASAPIVFCVLNNFIAIVAIVVAVTATCVMRSPSMTAKREARRARSREAFNRKIDAGVCPSCDGEPFEKVLQNGLTGCFECNSRGTSEAYLSVSRTSR
jgi:ribosomal protein L37AE/L43A